MTRPGTPAHSPQMTKISPGEIYARPDFDNAPSAAFSISTPRQKTGG
jgi:hypothetical protein